MRSDKMTKKGQNENISTKQLIEQEAIKLFYNDGYSKTTLRKIAENCNIEHPGLFTPHKRKKKQPQKIMNRYFAWLNNESVKFSKTCTKEEWANQYPLLYYWTLHYVLMKGDEHFSAFQLEYTRNGFESILAVAIEHTQHLPRLFSNKNYNKKGNDLFIDVNILAHCEMALSEMILHKQIDINRAVLFAVKVMNLIDDLGIAITQEMVDGFINKYFPIENRGKYNHLLEMIENPS